MKLMVLVGSRIAFSFSQWLVISSLVWLDRVDLVGQLNVGLATATIVTAFWSMGIRNAAATDTRNHHTDREYLWFSVALLVFGPILTVPFLQVLGLGHLVVSVTLYACMAIKAIDFMFENSYGLLQRRSLEIRIAISFLLRAISFPVIFISVLYMTGSLAVAIFASSVGMSILLGIGILWTLRRAPTESANVEHSLFSAIDLRGFLSTHLPLGISLVLGTAAITIPRIFSTSIEAEEQAAAFALFYIAFQSLNVLLTAFLQFSLPSLARMLDERRIDCFIRSVVRTVAALFMTSTILCVIVTLFGQHVLSFVYGEEIGSFSQFAILLSLGWGVRYISTGFLFAIRSARQFHAQLHIDMLGLSYVGGSFLAAAAFAPTMSGFCVAFLVSQVLALTTNIAFFGFAIRRISREV